MFLLKSVYTIRTVSTIQILSKSTYIYEMNKAYVRKIDPESFDFTFEYKNQELKVDRQFNFSRKLSENVSSFLGRIATNVEKSLNKKKRKNDDNQTFLTDKITLTQNNEKVDPNQTCEDLFNKNGDIRLTILDNEYQIKVNTPWIKSVVLPSSILSNFPVYPSKFESVFIDKALSEFTWYKSSDKKSWTQVGNEFLYTPRNVDINCYLKLHCLPKNAEETGLTTEVIAENTVQADPGPCPFEIRHRFTEEKLHEKKVVTYNLLADVYCDSDYARNVLFSYCPPFALNIDYRKQLIIKEIIGYNADLVCLQEVDQKVFENDLEPVLAYVGFQGEFHKKGGTLREGLACFYDSQRFSKVESYFLVLGEEINKNPLFSHLWEAVSKNENLAKRITERTTTLSVMLLDSKDNEEMLLVANTHFYFHPDADHIRLITGAMSIIYLDDLKHQMSQKYGKRVSTIFCGDFNSTPDCGTYKLYTSGFVSEDAVDWKSNAEEAISGLNLTQNMLMLSACGTPQYTNFTVGFQDCLDYIYCEKNSFEVLQVIPLPSYEELALHKAIPSIVFPSDHVSLVADLKWL